MLVDVFLGRFVSLIFLFVACGGLSWLHVSFLLHVKCTVSYRIVTVVFGCADMAQIPNAVVRRHGHTVVVKCNYDGQTYLLTCSNNRWNGRLANCSKGRVLRHTMSLVDWSLVGWLIVRFSSTPSFF